jgi:hypothetical protein
VRNPGTQGTCVLQVGFTGARQGKTQYNFLMLFGGYKFEVRIMSLRIDFLGSSLSYMYRKAATVKQGSMKLDIILLMA